MWLPSKSFTFPYLTSAIDKKLSRQTNNVMRYNRVYSKIAGIRKTCLGEKQKKKTYKVLSPILFCFRKQRLTNQDSSTALTVTLWLIYLHLFMLLLPLTLIPSPCTEICRGSEKERAIQGHSFQQQKTH